MSICPQCHGKDWTQNLSFYQDIYGNTPTQNGAQTCLTQPINTACTGCGGTGKYNSFGN